MCHFYFGILFQRGFKKGIQDTAEQGDLIHQLYPACIFFIIVDSGIVTVGIARESPQYVGCPLHELHPGEPPGIQEFPAELEDRVFAVLSALVIPDVVQELEDVLDLV